MRPFRHRVLFPDKIGGADMALHRPVSEGLGGRYV
jgi:hypothetical protein